MSFGQVSQEEREHIFQKTEFIKLYDNIEEQIKRTNSSITNKCKSLQNGFIDLTKTYDTLRRENIEINFQNLVDEFNQCYENIKEAVNDINKQLHEKEDLTETARLSNIKVQYTQTKSYFEQQLTDIQFLFEKGKKANEKIQTELIQFPPLGESGISTCDLRFKISTTPEMGSQTVTIEKIKNLIDQAGKKKKTKERQEQIYKVYEEVSEKVNELFKSIDIDTDVRKLFVDVQCDKKIVDAFTFGDGLELDTISSSSLKFPKQNKIFVLRTAKIDDSRIGRVNFINDLKYLTIIDSKKFVPPNALKRGSDVKEVIDFHRKFFYIFEYSNTINNYIMDSALMTSKSTLVYSPEFLTTVKMNTISKEIEGTIDEFVNYLTQLHNNFTAQLDKLLIASETLRTEQDKTARDVFIDFVIHTSQELDTVKFVYDANENSGELVFCTGSDNEPCSIQSYQEWIDFQQKQESEEYTAWHNFYETTKQRLSTIPIQISVLDNMKDAFTKLINHLEMFQTKLSHGRHTLFSFNVEFDKFQTSINYKNVNKENGDKFERMKEQLTTEQQNSDETWTRRIKQGPKIAETYDLDTAFPMLPLELEQSYFFMKGQGNGIIFSEGKLYSVLSSYQELPNTFRIKSKEGANFTIEENEQTYERPYVFHITSNKRVNYIELLTEFICLYAHDKIVLLQLLLDTKNLEKFVYQDSERIWFNEPVITLKDNVKKRYTDVISDEKLNKAPYKEVVGRLDPSQVLLPCQLFASQSWMRDNRLLLSAQAGFGKSNMYYYVLRGLYEMIHSSNNIEHRNDTVFVLNKSVNIKKQFTDCFFSPSFLDLTLNDKEIKDINMENMTMENVGSSLMENILLLDSGYTTKNGTDDILYGCTKPHTKGSADAGQLKNKMDDALDEFKTDFVENVLKIPSLLEFDTYDEMKENCQVFLKMFIRVDKNCINLPMTPAELETKVNDLTIKKFCSQVQCYMSKEKIEFEQPRSEKIYEKLSNGDKVKIQMKLITTFLYKWSNTSSKEWLKANLYGLNEKNFENERYNNRIYLQSDENVLFELCEYSKFQEQNWNDKSKLDIMLEGETPNDNHLKFRRMYYKIETIFKDSFKKYIRNMCKIYQEYEIETLKEGEGDAKKKEVEGDFEDIVKKYLEFKQDGDEMKNYKELLNKIKIKLNKTLLSNSYSDTVHDINNLRGKIVFLHYDSKFFESARFVKYLETNHEYCSLICDEIDDCFTDNEKSPFITQRYEGLNIFDLKWRYVLGLSATLGEDEESMFNLTRYFKHSNSFEKSDVDNLWNATDERITKTSLFALKKVNVSVFNTTPQIYPKLNIPLPRVNDEKIKEILKHEGFKKQDSERFYPVACFETKEETVYFDLFKKVQNVIKSYMESSDCEKDYFDSNHVGCIIFCNSKKSAKALFQNVKTNSERLNLGVLQTDGISKTLEGRAKDVDNIPYLYLNNKYELYHITGKDNEFSFENGKLFDKFTSKCGGKKIERYVFLGPEYARGTNFKNTMFVFKFDDNFNFSDEKIFPSISMTDSIQMDGRIERRFAHDGLCKKSANMKCPGILQVWLFALYEKDDKFNKMNTKKLMTKIEDIDNYRDMLTGCGNVSFGTLFFNVLNKFTDKTKEFRTILLEANIQNLDESVINKMFSVLEETREIEYAAQQVLEENLSMSRSEYKSLIKRLMIGF